jgi:hypothetical protein
MKPELLMPSKSSPVLQRVGVSPTKQKQQVETNTV